MRQLSFLFLSLLFLIPSAAHAQSQSKQEEGTSRDSAFQVESIALLNSTNEFGQRSPSAKIMGGYIKSIEAADGWPYHCRFRESQAKNPASETLASQA